MLALSAVNSPPPDQGAADWRIAVVCDTPRASSDIAGVLQRPFKATLVAPAQFPFVAWDRFDAIIVDAWEKTANDLETLGGFLARLSHLNRPLLLIIGRSMRVLLARMGLLTGVTTFARPLEPENLTDVLATLLASRPGAAALRRTTRAAYLAVPEHAQALTAADEALELIFALGLRPGAAVIPEIDRHAGTIIDSLSASGIGGWISGVRQHHDSTYQHCLLVTGMAIAFGHHLGFPRADMRRIALGALLHDVGKARIPVGILDKPGALTADEKAVIMRHPEHGLEALAGQPAITDELKSIVLSHHEYLDGSGYPQGLGADSIPDIVRLVTVADVFGALIEKRAYRSALGGADAYDILLAMDGKLDMSIVKAVRSTVLTAPN
jgi:putative nucleotidyltransferase with HDIG domain